MEHITNLLDRFSSLYPVSEAFTNSIKPLPALRKLRAGQVLELREPACMYYVIKGLAKGSYDDLDGKEHITRFWKEKETILIMQPLIENFMITILEDSELLYLSPRRLLYLYNRFPETVKLASKILSKDQTMANTKISISSLPAKQAYMEFKLLFPYRRIKLKDIASYLEVTPGTLSEIRRIKKK